MPCTSRTADFREVVQVKYNALPEPQRRKSARNRGKASVDGTNPLGKEYVSEAYNILKHITTLSGMLNSVRKPYLNIDGRTQAFASRPGDAPSRMLNLSTVDGASLPDIRHLTNEERDQIDLQARVILSRCADRVKEMEVLEKRRAELIAKKANPIARLIPARLRVDATSVSSEYIAAHHSSITWYLNRRLADVSQSQKEMQEERVKRQLERTRTLGSGVAREAANLSSVPLPTELPSSSTPRNGSGARGWLESSIAATIGAPNPGGDSTSSSANPYSTSVVVPPDEFDESDEEDFELSQSQIMQFEAENQQMLRQVQDTLESVQQAEQHLMDISALQMELVQHLTQQSELSDQLYEDAIATTGMIEKGNDQLREAKRRAAEGRKYLLFMFIGLSFSLLFLHYY